MGFFEKVKTFMGFVEEEDSNNYSAQQVPRKPLVKFSAGSNNIATSEIKVLEPKDPDQSLEIAQSLREGIPVVINLRYLETDEAKRLFDFICGTTYAIDGSYRKLGENILLFTPNNINIVDQMGSPEVKGISLEKANQA